MVAVVVSAYPSHAEKWLDVELPALDKDEILLEQLNRGNASSFPGAITQEWDWTAMSQADLMHHALPVLRAGADLCGEQVVEFHGELICDFFPFYLSDLPIANAYTDGRYIYITAGMVRELKSIDEYRAVIGHEIGHILSGHVYKRLKAARRAALWGAAFGGLLSVAAASQGVFVDGVVEDAATVGAVFGSLRFSQQFELEADYIGAYLLARSGGSIEAAKQMWRRWGTGEEGTWLSFHPTGAERFALLSATENETEEKRESKVAIVPNIRGSEKPSTLRYFSAALDRFDSDDNGRITCREARQHGIAPVPRDHPAYGYVVTGPNVRKRLAQELREGKRAEKCRLNSR